MLSLVPVTKSLAKAAFDCGVPELNQYLRQYSIKNDQLSIGKTFLTLTQEGRVAGYFTVSTAQIVADTLPIEIQNKLPRYPVPAFRLGKLGVDLAMQGSGLGKWLLTQALQKAVDISGAVGVYAVVIDAIDENAKRFYQKYGFTPFSSMPLTLFLPLETIKAAITPDSPGHTRQ